MIVINGVGAFASTPWTIDPSDYRYDMSLYLDMEFKDGRMDYSLYTVGAFVGDECRGIAEALKVSNGSQCLYLRARSNEESGEQMTFKYWNKETDEVNDIIGVSFDFESNGRLGYPSEPYIVNIIRYYDVAMTASFGGSVNLEDGRFEEGTQLVVTATPEDGYHFTQWSDGVTENPRTITVNGSISLVGEFAPNYYKLTYIIDDEIYDESEVEFGSEIVPKADLEKDGYTFSGWEGLPETMPAHDVTVIGSFSINSYNVVFKIDGDVIETKSIVFGQPIVAPEAPAKEGHTFAGWKDVPEAMPAHDIEIVGSYDINSYLLSIYIDDELIRSEMIEYGSVIEIKDPEVPEGMIFDGWNSEIPETMPAHDVEIYGSYSKTSGVSRVDLYDDMEVAVFDMNGHILYRNKVWRCVKDKLSDGIYIINGLKVVVKN